MYGAVPMAPSVVISSTQVVERFPKCAGDYFKGSKYFCGRPVYENKDGMILYCSVEGKWSIGDKIGVATTLLLSADFLLVATRIELIHAYYCTCTVTAGCCSLACPA